MCLTSAEILTWILAYKYLIIFPLAVFEGPITTVTVGFLVFQNLINYFFAFILILAADLGGDCLYYAAGYWGRTQFIEKWGVYFGISPKITDSLQKRFKKNAGSLLIQGKIYHGIGAAYLLAAGLARMGFWKFLLYNFLVTVPKSIVLLLIGYYYGEKIATIGSVLDAVALTVIALAILITIGWVVKKQITC